MNPDLIERMYTEHKKTVYQICVILLKNKQDAEDAMSEVFMKLYKSGKVFENFEHEKAWLITVAKNICFDSFRNFWRRVKSLDSAKNVCEVIRTDETLSLVAKLSKIQRMAVYLHYYAGYSLEEMSRLLKVKENTIKSHLHRARQRLKLEMENE
ncbi:MAG: RNA polymerase sigma factor [Firmicutes bacterium]|nr:RNA polymerase sigma factor [Bacillota bacterium]